MASLKIIKKGMTIYLIKDEMGTAYLKIYVDDGKDRQGIQDRMKRIPVKDRQYFPMRDSDKLPYWIIWNFANYIHVFPEFVEAKQMQEKQQVLI